ncbi:hypothetical protein CCP3SC15_660011 [Gammaproteobacteria bacterium]
MRLIIFDPGYAHRNSHHHDVNRQLVESLTKAGWYVTLVASRSIDSSTADEIRATGAILVPHFVTPCYYPNIERLDLGIYQQLADRFADEITELASLIPLSDAWLFHTGYSLHFIALARALWRWQARAPTQLVALMMFAPSTVSDVQEQEPEWLRYRLAFQLLWQAAQRRGVKVTLGTSCRGYQKIWQSLWPYGTVILHPAVNYRSLPMLQVPSKKPCVLLYLGSPKNEKGLKWSAHLTMAGARQWPDVNFIFHFNHHFWNAARNFADVIATLDTAAAKYSNILFVRGHIDASRYDNLLQQTTILTLLYDPYHYRMKTSGILWDGLRLPDLRWLVTSESWLEKELHEIGLSCTTVRYGDTPQVLMQMENLLKQPLPRDYPATLDQDYLQQLLQPLGGWLKNILEQHSSYNLQ